MTLIDGACSPAELVDRTTKDNAPLGREGVGAAIKVLGAVQTVISGLVCVLFFVNHGALLLKRRSVVVVLARQCIALMSSLTALHSPYVVAAFA
jgi:hypothetical protein